MSREITAIPQLTTAQINALTGVPTNTIVFNTDSNFLNVWTGIAWVPIGPQSVSYSYQVPSGTNGGPLTISLAANQRPLNTFSNPQNVTWASVLTANQFTLQPGVYQATGFGVCTSLESGPPFQTQLFNVTAGTAVAQGIVGIIDDGTNDGSNCPFADIFSIAVPSVFEIDSIPSSAGNTPQDMGQPLGGPNNEIYTSVLLTKIQ